MKRQVIHAVLTGIMGFMLLGTSQPLTSGWAATMQQGGCRTFAETNRAVCGRFQQYWNTHGGLTQQGFPISGEIQEKSETNGQTYMVQYFERAVFEMHPENRAPNDVLLSLLGNFLYQQKYAGNAPAQEPNKSAGSSLFQQTGKRLGGKFLQYWQKNGGLAQQGYPISDEFMERSDLDGKTYRVQYFERAVFEYHPENKAPYDVLLSQLGTFRYRQLYASSDMIKIGIDLPTSGADASDGIPARNGMQLAIDQANAAGGVTLADGKTYKLRMFALDDAVNGVHNPEQGYKNAQTFIADPRVMVMLDPFNSSVARAMMPIMNVAGLCNISPSNTNETLTKPEYGRTQDFRPTGKVTYFRVSTTDDLQGPASADWAYDTLNIRKVYVLDDTETYGRMLADNFEKRFLQRSGSVLGRMGVPRGTIDFRTILGKVALTRPDMLFYGGTTSNGLALARKQMPDVGLNVPFMGGDGIEEQAFTDITGEAGNNSYATVAAVNTDVLPEAKQFNADYRNTFKEEPGAYSGPSYEAAGVAIDAIKRGGKADRSAVCQALRETKDYKGITGSISFDENGDTTNRIISIYEVKLGKWEFVDQIRFEK